MTCAARPIFSTWSVRCFPSRPPSSLSSASTARALGNFTPDDKARAEQAAGGRLTAPGLTRLVHAAPHGAARDGDTAHSCRLSRPARPPLTVTVAPLNRWPDAPGPLALVLLRDPEQVDAASAALRDLFDLTPTEAVLVPALAPQIELPVQAYAMTQDEFHDYKGRYDLSNGQTLRLFNHGGAMYAEIDHQGEHRLVASKYNAFVATDRQLKMRIDLNDDGTVDGELTMVLPAPSMASGVPPRLLVAVLR